MMRRSQDGFSLAELMISMAIMLLIAGGATTALLKMTSAQATIWNRTQMHSGIRGATEVLQQEVGQAGRIALPSARASIAADVTTGASRTVGMIQCPTTTACTTASVDGMFVGQKLVVDGTTSQETVVLTAVDTSAKTITATFAHDHVGGAPVRALGAFSSGVVPPAASPTSFTNGSTGTVLKLFGDINADGQMVYIEYKCDIPAAVGGVQAPGYLYRNSMAWNYRDSVAWNAAVGSPEPVASQILLSNIMPNPDSSACFTYQTVGLTIDHDGLSATAPVMTYFVTDVAITLTVQTQLLDPVTKRFQTETKALLNVSPRNVFNAWTVASLGLTERIQVTPPSVLALLP